ncbi:hypothetical protein Dimus_036109, partial [Dionaea muscipula]
MDATPQLMGMEDEDNENAEALRLNHMYQETIKLVSFAAPRKDMYLAYMENLKLLTNKLQSMTLNIGAALIEDVVGKTVTNDVGEASGQDEAQFGTPLSRILDPKVSQTKGRKRGTNGKEIVEASGRIKSGIELATEKNLRKCRVLQTNMLKQLKISKARENLQQSKLVVSDPLRFLWVASPKLSSDSLMISMASSRWFLLMEVAVRVW